MKKTGKRAHAGKRKAVALFLVGMVLCGLSGCQTPEGKAPEEAAFRSEAGEKEESSGEDRSTAEEETPVPTAGPDDGGEESAAEKMLAGMTLEEKVGQLFMVRPEALSGGEASHPAGVTEVTDTMRETLKKYPVGGIVVFGQNIESPDQLKTFTGDVARLEGIPLFLAVDEEGGSVARLANAEGFDLKRYASASATEDASEMGHTIGAYLREYGFHMDFAPVADVNSNPENPVIGTRAFSDDAQQVRKSAYDMAQALLAEGIMPVYKHFPGHGDTKEDSHQGLAVTHKTVEEMQQLEWVPYEGRDIPAVMVAHVAAPQAGVDGPSSLSYRAVTQWLRGMLRHDGLVITDALEMGAITETYTAGEAAVAAIKAGVDILLMPEDLPEAFDAVAAAVESGEIGQARLDESVRRILQAKESLGMLGLLCYAPK